nr:MAG TPA: hypothetical protein [Caudoviricetes sp.]
MITRNFSATELIASSNAGASKRLACQRIFTYFLSAY